MKELLTDSYLAHYNLSDPKIIDFILKTSERYFELEDVDKELVLCLKRSDGTAKFSNRNTISFTILNYEKFLTALPNAFQRGKGRCDFVMVCDAIGYFILGEIKNSSEIKAYRNKAKKQLISSLITILDVPDILAFSNKKAIRRCCYFNKQSNSPSVIQATRAFNRLSTLYPDGYKMRSSDIEAFDFEFWEYTGEQTMALTPDFPQANL